MNMNDTGNRVIAGVVIVLLVIGAWYLGTTFKPATGTKVTMATSTSGTNIGSSTNASTNTTGTTPAGATLTVSGGAVSVKDQPAGSSVLVSSVTLAQLGWVAVRDSSGRTLGAALFGAGTYSAVQVPLLRNTVSGEHYQVLLYADDGDKVFDLHKDTLVMNADGTVAGTTFTAN
jgi:hypothetical protein